TFLANKLGSVPVLVVEREDRTRRQIDDRTREFAFLYDAPNTDEDAVPWWTRCWAHLEGWSNAFLYRRTVGMGSMRRTVGLDLLHPSRVKVTQLRSGRRRYDYRAPKANSTTEYSRDQICHIMRLSWDGLRGASPVAAAAAAHRIAGMQDAWQMSHYRRSARPSGAVTTPAEYDDLAVAEFYDSWDEQIGSPKGSGVVLLQGNTKYEPIIPSTDEHMLAARQYSRETILGVYAPGLPHHVLGWRSNTSNFGTGLEIQGLHMLANVFEPRHNLARDVVSRHLLPPSLMVDWDVRQWIKSEAKTIAEVYSKARAGGAVTGDEWRAAMGLEAEDAVDTFWVPKNMTAIDRAGRVVTAAGGAA
ncbi:MAG: phage portal protein, partial [Acidobacteria bacterium]|nr:phage portal protein [Acidobacteriota bacterium]